jgi:hypothetical protein
MQQMDVVYELIEKEQNYCNSLEKLAQEDFRKYAQGIKYDTLKEADWKTCKLRINDSYTDQSRDMHHNSSE